MQVRGRGWVAAVVPIRTWVVALDRCLAILAFTSVLLVIAWLTAVWYAGELCPDE